MTNPKLHTTHAIQQTHWLGCWEERSHYQCAVRLIAQLRDEITLLRDDRDSWLRIAKRARDEAIALQAKIDEAPTAQPVQPSLTTNSAQISSGLVVEDGKVIEGAKENSRDS